MKLEKYRHPFIFYGFALILPDKELREELKSACTNFKDVHWKWYAFVFLFPFAVILLAQAISLLFGHSAQQFRFVENFSFSAGHALTSGTALRFCAL